MPDKYHTEWKYRDFATNLRIFRGQEQAFVFLGDMAHDLDGVIGILEGIKHLPAIVLQLEFYDRKCFYLALANSIGRLWSSVQKGEVSNLTSPISSNIHNRRRLQAGCEPDPAPEDFTPCNPGQRIRRTTEDISG